MLIGTFWLFASRRKCQGSCCVSTNGNESRTCCRARRPTVDSPPRITGCLSRRYCGLRARAALGAIWTRPWGTGTASCHDAGGIVSANSSRPAPQSTGRLCDCCNPKPPVSPTRGTRPLLKLEFKAACGCNFFVSGHGHRYWSNDQLYTKGSIDGQKTQSHDLRSSRAFMHFADRETSRM